MNTVGKIMVNCEKVEKVLRNILYDREIQRQRQRLKRRDTDR